MTLEVLNTSGQPTGRTVNLSDAIFGITPVEHAVYLDVKQYLANQRQGTHKSKERAEIARTTKKLKKQKGTGGARAGSMKSPVFIGGGRVFGPRPRSYGFKLNKKLKDLARKSVLADKLATNSIIVVENINMTAPKTKQYAGILNAVAAGAKKTLLVLPDNNANVVLSSRNLPNAKVQLVNNLNTYEMLNADKLVFVEGSIEKLENHLLS